MNTWFNLPGIFEVGKTVANRSLGLSFALLGTCFVIAYVVEYAGLALPGRVGDRNPMKVVVQAFALVLVLLMYGKIVGAVSQTSASISGTMGRGSDFSAFVNKFGDAIEKRFSTDNKTVLEIMGDYSSGIISAGVTTIGIIGAAIVLQLFYGIQTVLFAILVAVGPLVIACCILPGATSLLSRWLTALIEVACWPIIGAVVLEMCMRAGIAQFYSDGATNWLKLLAANVLLIASVALIPTIASRLVGSGFGSVGPMMGAMAQRQLGMFGGLSGNAGKSAKDAGKIAGGVASAAGSVGRAVMRGSTAPPPVPPTERAGARDNLMNNPQPPAGDSQ